VRANLKEKELGLADHAYNSRYARSRGGRISIQFLPWTKNVGLYLKNNYTGVVAEVVAPLPAKGKALSSSPNPGWTFY
jgi:hypothetical protein